MTVETLLDINPAISVNDVTLLEEQTNTFVVTGFIDVDDKAWFYKRGFFHMKDKSFTYKKRGKNVSREKIRACKTFQELCNL